jgi:hypothetical protein
VTVGHGLRLFPPEVTEAVEWVLRHFFPPNQLSQYCLVVVTVKHTSALAIGPVGPGTQVVRSCCSWMRTRPKRRRVWPTSSTTPGTSARGHGSTTLSSMWSKGMEAV